MRTVLAVAILALGAAVVAAAPAPSPAPSSMTVVNTWKISPAAITQTGCAAYVIPFKTPFVPEGGTITLPHVLNSCANQGLFWAFSLPRPELVCQLWFPNRKLVNGADTQCTYDVKTNTFTYVLTPQGQELVRKAMAAFKK